MDILSSSSKAPAVLRLLRSKTFSELMSLCLIRMSRVCARVRVQKSTSACTCLTKY